MADKEDLNSDHYLSREARGSRFVSQGPTGRTQPQERYDALLKAIAALPPELREVLELRGENFSFQEIGKLLNIRAETATRRWMISVEKISGITPEPLARERKRHRDKERARYHAKKGSVASGET